ncbi:MAG: aminotransferase class IV [Bacteroidia bacterium]|nr:aminotransferase class IV [Bacteroidia bacterium]MBT8278399.1 aminotransferase class IV [Bacteroidia bacterium]NND24951.1 aminotransferase class IV [Flavobacteriaceae bacterium]NNK60578.1 aminotransferase class IV [Flavobacteriaceae bacterium]NNL31597.1 aminotransferase class IV [Flavobacteriaceae bacterium]
MINLNGTLIPASKAAISLNNRGLTYGDAVFETLRTHQGKILFWEDHYFRLMASMRIMRMEIPMNFTLEFIEDQVLKTLEANGLENSTARVKIFINRREGGLYNPDNMDIDYFIQVAQLHSSKFKLDQKPYVVDLYKDFFISKGLFSTLKTNNRAINVLGSVFAKENDFQNCLLLNTDKMVIEALNANVFIVQGNTIKTPPLDDGCIKGVMRKQIIDIIENDSEFELDESSISPFELQKADELFITNVIVGIQSVTQYRKKQFKNKVAQKYVEALNSKAELS